jgi:hypothetical protein
MAVGRPATRLSPTDVGDTVGNALLFMLNDSNVANTLGILWCSSSLVQKVKNSHPKKAGAKVAGQGIRKRARLENNYAAMKSTESTFRKRLPLSSLSSHTGLPHTT